MKGVRANVILSVHVPFGGVGRKGGARRDRAGVCAPALSLPVIGQAQRRRGLRRRIAPPTRPVAHTGWPAVRANYERFWSSLARLTVTMEKPIVTIHGDVGWVHGIENTQRIGVSGETSGGRNFGTSIFVRHDARWRMVFHQAAPMPD